MAGSEPVGLRSVTPAGRLVRTLDRPGFWVLVLVAAVAGVRVGDLLQEAVGLGRGSYQDEHTFVLMAAHVLDGALPYVGLYDNKFPGIFYMLAGVFALFGETLATARVASAVSLLALCVATFATARRWTDSVSAGVGTLVVVASAAGRLGQEVNTEYPSMALFMVALWLLLAKRERLWAVGVAGLCISLATLVRANLGVAAAAFGIWLVGLAVVSRRGSLFPGKGRADSSAPRVGWPAVAVFAACGLIPPGLLFLVYWRADALAALALGMIKAPMSYASRLGVIEVFLLQFENVWAVMRSKPFLVPAFLLSAVAGVGALVKRPAKIEEEWLLGIAFGAVALCILIGGTENARYGLLLVPVGAVFSARGVDFVLFSLRRASASLSAWARAVLGTACAVGAAASLAAAVIGHVSGPPVQHPLRHVASVVAADRMPGDAVWVMDFLLVNWYLDVLPAFGVAHEAVLDYEVIASPLVAAGYMDRNMVRTLVASRPTYLVKCPASICGRRVRRKGFSVPRYLTRYNPEDAEYLRETADRDYAVFYDDGMVRVYKALGAPSA